MDVIKTIAPGQPGSKRFLNEWGDALVAVRYRRASESSETLTTIEVIVDRRAFLGKNKTQHAALANRNHAIVALKISYHEQELRVKVKQAGALWSKQLKCWLLRYDKVVELGLLERIEPGAAETCTDVDITLITYD